MKRYKLRPFGIAWWTVYGGGTLFTLVSAYICICAVAALGAVR